MVITVITVIFSVEFLDSSNIESKNLQYSPEEQNLPNIVVIMVDDLDVVTLETMLNKGLMPNLQKFFIERGTEFTNSFVSTSECCPSRSTFLTGQYSHNHGVLRNQLVRNLDDNQTLATWLDNSGYRTGLVGKYLNLYGILIEPTYVPPGWDNWQSLIEPSAYSVYNYTINDGGTILSFGDSPSDYQTDVLATFSSNFIVESEKQNDEEPFFLFITPIPPHTENVGEQCSIHRFSDRIIRPPERFKGT